MEFSSQPKRCDGGDCFNSGSATPRQPRRAPRFGFGFGLPHPQPDFAQEAFFPGRERRMKKIVAVMATTKPAMNVCVSALMKIPTIFRFDKR